MRTSNPALNSKFFANLTQERVSDDAAMTIDGTIQKTGILVFMLAASATFSWYLLMHGYLNLIVPMILAGLLGSFVIFLIMMFKKSWSPVLAPIYAVLEGLLIGSISFFAEIQALRSGAGGIVLPATLLTFTVALSLLGLYAFRIIKVTERMRSIIMMSTMAIFFTYLFSWIFSLFGLNMPYIHSNGIIGIGFSLVVCGIAALNLLLDFHGAERAVEAKAPKYYEWYFGFATLVTLVWLYMEILRLLQKFNSRD